MEDGRKNTRSGIIITSSIAQKASIGAGTQYEASKIFCSFLGEAVAYELEKANSRVDLTVLSPGYVVTNLTRKMKKNCLFVTPKKCVYKTLIDLGRETETNGAMTHEITGYLASVVMQHWLTLGFRSQ